MAMPGIPLFSLCSLLLLLLRFQYLLASKPDGVLLLPLTHSLSHSRTANLTAHHLIKASSLRSAARHRGRQNRGPRPSLHREVSLPLAGGSDYTLSLSVGRTDVELYMDTGSDLVWFPCSPFECIICEGEQLPAATTGNTPPPPPAGSQLIGCRSAVCSAVHSGVPSSDLCAVAGCPLEDIETSSCASAACPPFYYAYGDGSLVGHLRRGHLCLGATAAGDGESSGGLRLPNFTFACAHSALAEPVGVAGFGRGLLSLPAQLAKLSPGLAAGFSYCLVSHSFKPDRLIRPSPLILGRSGSTKLDQGQFVYTPLLHNPKHPYFYSVGLEALFVGRSRVVAHPDLARVDSAGNGGLVVDSGTTFTMLPKETHSLLTTMFDRQMKSAGFDRAVEAESETGLGPCYYYRGKAETRPVPALGFLFKGNATVLLPRRNYFMGLEKGGKKVGCLMVMDGGDLSGGKDYDGPAGTLGNFQQQGMEVVYDLAGGRVGFARRRCAALWESLSRA